MLPDSPKLLEDIRASAAFILDKTRGKAEAEYLADDLLRPAVERHFEIIGEALGRLRRSDPQTLARVPDHLQIIAFRNVLVHGYDVIDHRRVWDAIRNSLPTFLNTVTDLLGQQPPETPDVTSA